MMKRVNRWIVLGTRGVSIAEFAMVTPILVMLTMGVVDLGRAYFCYITVVDAAREGARYGVAHQDSTDMCARALAEAQDQPLQATLTCVADPGHGSGTPASVTVSCDFPLIMGGLVGRSSIPISNTAVFRIR